MNSNCIPKKHFYVKKLAIFQSKAQLKAFDKLKEIHSFLLFIFISTNLFYHLMGGFPFTAPDDCISGPKRIPACSWGHPTYTMRAQLLYTCIYPCQGPGRGMRHPCYHTTMDSGSWVPQHRTLRARPLNLTFKGGEVSSPRHLPHPDYPSFHNWRQKPAQSRRT